jgi:hypothetical protein
VLVRSQQEALRADSKRVGILPAPRS